MKKVIFLFREKDDAIPNEFSAAITWWYGILENMGYDVMYYDYANFNFDNFYKEAKEFQPDYVIHACYEPIHTEFVRLREFCKTYVIQSDDDYRFGNYARFWIPLVDGVISFCGEREEMKKLYYAHGATEKSFLHGYWCFNPNTMMLDEYPTRTVPMTHMGSIYGNRPAIINEFQRLGVPVNTHSRVVYQEFKKLTAQSRFTLCLTMAAPQTMRQLKGRLFELPNLAVLVSEQFPNMETYYDLEKEIIVFNSVPEAVDKMNRLKNEEDYNKVFQAGRRRLLSQHTCYHVWDKYILPKMDEDYKPLDVAKILKETHGIVT